MCGLPRREVLSSDLRNPWCGGPAPNSPEKVRVCKQWISQGEFGSSFLCGNVEGVQHFTLAQARVNGRAFLTHRTKRTFILRSLERWRVDMRCYLRRQLLEAVRSDQRC